VKEAGMSFRSVFIALVIGFGLVLAGYRDDAEKKRRRRDSGERRSKKARTASQSSGRAGWICAVVPSRRIKRPDSAASW
jgi:hypothetical protein